MAIRIFNYLFGIPYITGQSYFRLMVGELQKYHQLGDQTFPRHYK